MTTTVALLELRKVTRVLGEPPNRVHAVTDLDLVLQPGELVALMGPSGSGKTTVLNLAGGLDTPTYGEVFVHGGSLARLSRTALSAIRRRHVGFVFQTLDLLPSLTAVENVAAPRELDGIGAGQARIDALVALEAVGLADLADRFPGDLSGGQRQRVAVARAMVGERSVILADEPTGALDSQTGEDVMRVLRARCDAGLGAVVATHDARHAAWADRVVFLRDGVVVDESKASA